MSRKSSAAASAGAPIAATSAAAAAVAGVRTTVKVESLGKFDPAVEGSFRIFHIRLRSIARSHGLGPAMDISHADLEDILRRAPDASTRTVEEQTLVDAATTLYLMLSVAIDANSVEGQDLVSLLYDKYERMNTGLDWDNGAGAYKDMVQTYDKATKASTINLFDSLKSLKLKGSSPNEVQAYESELSRSFKKLEQAGEVLSEGQKVAYLLSGLDALGGWDSFVIDVKKEELKGGTVQYDAILKQLRELAPAVEGQVNRATERSGNVYVAATGGATKMDCWRCNNTFSPKGRHGPDECKAKRYTCNVCGERGHVKAGCKRQNEQAIAGGSMDGANGSEVASLTAVLKKLDTRLERMEQVMSNLSRQESSTLAITNNSGSSGVHFEEMEDEKIEYGGIIF